MTDVADFDHALHYLFMMGHSHNGDNAMIPPQVIIANTAVNMTMLM